MTVLTPGDVFAGHRIDNVAGAGGMGIVYRATHLALDHQVALKVLSPTLVDDERFRERFRSESRLAVSIRHPNVVPIHHAGEEDGLLFVTMDLIHGTDLRGLLNAGPLKPESAVRIASAVAGALDAAHAKGLVHRDVKPGNVLIEGSDASGHVYVTDFGLAKHVEDSGGVTATGAFVGTIDYVAPEQIKGEATDARTDVYALGCVLYEMLAGHVPFARQETNVAKMYAHLQEQPPPLAESAEAPDELKAVAGRALAKDPGERYPSAGDLARAAAAAVEGRAVSSAERNVGIGAAAPTQRFDALGADASSAAAATAAPAGRPELSTEEGTEPATEATEATVGPEPAPQPADVPGTSRADRRRLVLPAAAALVAAAGVALILLLSSGDGGGGERPVAQVGKPIEAGVFPVAAAVAGDRVLVTDRKGGLQVIEAGADEAGAPVEVGSNPEGIAAEGDSIWMVSGGEDSASRLDLGSLQVAETIDVGAFPRDVAIGEGAVWVTNGRSGTVSRIDPDSPEASDLIEVGTEPHGVAVGEGSVWVVNRADNNVSEINPAQTGEIREHDVGDDPKGVVVAEGAAWVTNAGASSLSRIDAGSGEVTEVNVGPEPREVAAGSGYLWVTNGGDGTVSRVDPSSGEVVEEIRVGGSPEGLATGAGAVWVTGGADGEVTPIEP